MLTNFIDGLILYPISFFLITVALASLVWISYVVFYKKNFHNKLYKTYAVYGF